MPGNRRRSCYHHSSPPVAQEVAVLRDLPEHVRIGLGCVDVRFPEIDSPEQIVQRVEKALAHVPAGRLTLNPDCGFAPGKNHEVPLEEAYLELKNLAEAAGRLRERHG
jgi:5-methyltetrahydropteroyltriglutamate--homocysteine methyltransferase